MGNVGRCAGDYTRPMQVERSNDHRGESDARSYPPAAVNSTEIFSIQLYGVSEGEKRNDDFRTARKLKVQVWQQGTTSAQLAFRRRL